jgi:hypothetical protein
LQRNLTAALIRKCKVSYFANLNKKLQDPKLGPKKWWGIVKSLCGSKIQSKIPVIQDGHRVITDAKEKDELFNEYFISQCKVENNNAPVPILNALIFRT